MKIPIVLPVVHISVTAHGRFTIDIDGDLYEPASVFTRGDVGVVLDQITTSLESPVRVEVREADGTMYADIATPPDTPTPQAADQAASGTPARASGTGTGFQPGEEVAIAYVLTRQRADLDGNAPLRLPPSLLASRREGLVMVGLTSHVIASIQ